MLKPLPPVQLQTCEPNEDDENKIYLEIYLCRYWYELDVRSITMAISYEFSEYERNCCNRLRLFCQYFFLYLRENATHITFLFAHQTATDFRTTHSLTHTNAQVNANIESVNFSAYLIVNEIWNLNITLDGKSPAEFTPKIDARSFEHTHTHTHRQRENVILGCSWSATLGWWKCDVNSGYLEFKLYIFFCGSRNKSFGNSIPL